jgi:hypothetical protein
MYRILGARYTRSVERDNRIMAEVRVKVEEQPHEYIAYFSGTSGGEVDMPYLLYNDADFEIDFWDNPMHQAFDDISKDFGEDDKRIFCEEVLRIPGIRREIEQGLNMNVISEQLL